MPDIIYVNERDEEIGHGSIREAILTGTIKRVVQIFLFNTKGDVLIAKRGATAPFFPERWNASTAGHVDVGESYAHAAEREMQEEIGVSGVSLIEVGKAYMEEDIDGWMGKNFCTVYRGRYDGDIDTSSIEISEARWIRPDELEAWMAERPDDFTPTCRAGWQLVKTSKNVRDAIY